MTQEIRGRTWSSSDQRNMAEEQDRIRHRLEPFFFDTALQYQFQGSTKASEQQLKRQMFLEDMDK